MEMLVIKFGIGDQVITELGYLGTVVLFAFDGVNKYWVVTDHTRDWHYEDQLVASNNPSPVKATIKFSKGFKKSVIKKIKELSCPIVINIVNKCDEDE